MTSKPKVRRKRLVPRWATRPLRNALEDVERINEVLHLSINGIKRLRRLPALVGALQELDKAQGKSGDDFAKETERAKREARLAIRESREGFPVLHQQATILLYSALEAAIRGLVIAWITREPQVLTGDALKKVRISLVDHVKAEDAEQRAVLILNAIEREIGLPLKSALGRFDSLLGLVGLDGTIPEDVRKQLIEMTNVRHVIVHHRAMADARLVENCPWLNLKAGKKVRVTHDQWSQYRNAALDYLTEIVYRVGERFGAKVRPNDPARVKAGSPQDSHRQDS